ncbi:Imm49 family immunity protein [Pseudomonas abietaniphila]|uniref:Immunity protein 49 n=1 Tax=Pseudomonas abietaniphila TaxID=89065 RepID=A0A1G8UKB5_9PSED|nr:Imm49 family immunity protein [Pseudomonas abietaniphila]SDJ53410.1 Immunity protein 49 [Pseudomonas abietaniphila]
MDKNYEKKAVARLEHIRSHLEDGFDLDRIVELVTTGQGDVKACASRLSSHALAKAMWEWFDNKNLQAFKSWCYVAGMLRKYVYDLKTDTSGPLGKMLQMLTPLMSDNTQLIDWFCKETDSCFDMKRVSNCATIDHFAYLAILAIRGDWSILQGRCEAIVSNPAAAVEKFLPDVQFYLELARKDEVGMAGALDVIASSKRVSGRSNYESGFTDGLISSFAVMYSKIAWRHGFSLKIESVYIPAEWLPVAPLSSYDSKYAFLQ